MRRRAAAVGTTALALAAGLGAAAAPAPAAAQTYSGDGPGATPLFVLGAGTTPVHVQAEDRTFIALLIGTDGAVVAELNADPRQYVTLDREGRYLFDVRSSGPWRIAVEAPDSLRLMEIRGRLEGTAAAERQASTGWLARGLGGGLVLGPIGTLFVVQRANRSDLSPGADARTRLEAMPPVYRESFQEAFENQLRSDRRAAALVGGLTGTAVLAFVVLQLTVWGDGGGSTGEGPEPGPAADVLLPAGLQLRH